MSMAWATLICKEGPEANQEGGVSRHPSAFRQGDHADLPAHEIEMLLPVQWLAMHIFQPRSPMPIHPYPYKTTYLLSSCFPSSPPSIVFNFYESITVQRISLHKACLPTSENQSFLEVSTLTSQLSKSLNLRKALSSSSTRRC
jgi:hypothetical protein